MSAGPAIRLEEVRKTYRMYPDPRALALDVFGINRLLPRRRRLRFPEFEALRGINLTVGHGERWGVVGRNGAGKTTLLRLLTANHAPTSGKVEIDGTVQALFASDAQLIRELSGTDNVRRLLAYNGLWGSALEEAMEDVVDFVELGEFLERPVRTYSQGMRMRLEFAAATAIAPDILIVDEVLSAGDGYFSIKSAERVRSLAESGCTLLLVSHELEHVRAFCDQAVWLDAGQIVMTGPTEEVLEAYEGSFDEAGEASQPEPGQELAQGREERARRNAFELPEIFGTPFVVSKVRETEPIASSETPQEATLGGGVRVERWGNGGPVRIQDLDLRRAGERVDRVHTGDELSLSVRLKLTEGGEHALRCAVLVHSAEGELVARAVSPTDRFAGDAGAERAWTLELPELTLGSGDYALSCGVFDAARGDAISAAERIDYLSRAMALRVAPTNDTDPPILHWPSTWRCGDGEPEPGRISGVI